MPAHFHPYRQTAAVVAAALLSGCVATLSGCATVSTVPVAVQASVNANSGAVNRPFPVRVFLAEAPPSFSAEQRAQLVQALKTDLGAKGYAVRDEGGGGVVRVSYTLDKRVADEETAWVPSVGLYSGYGFRRFGFGFGTDIPLIRRTTRQVDELAITAFDENAGWVWTAAAQVDSDQRGLSVYPDLYRLLQDQLGKETDKVVRLPRPGAPAKP